MSRMKLLLVIPPLLLIVVLISLVAAGMTSSQPLASAPLQNTGDIVQVTPEEGEYRFPALLPLSGESLMMFYSTCCYDLYSKSSDDGGAIWSAPSLIIEGGVVPDAIQDQDGRIHIVYSRRSESTNSYDIFYRTSSGDGLTWSEEQVVAESPDQNIYPSIVRTDSGRLIVAYWASGAGIFYKTSDDNGATWSDPLALAESSGGIPDLAITAQGDIWAVYHACPEEVCNIYYRTSADNGDSWSPEALLESDGYSPSIASSGQELMLAFRRLDCSPITCDYDIWYRVATPENILQSPSVRYTAYRGTDWYPSVAALADGNFGIAWWSFRRFTEGIWTTSSTIWFGIPGVLEDLSPPPVVNRFYHLPIPNPDPNDEVFIVAEIDDDEPGLIADVVWTMDGVQQPDVPMADDGFSGDSQAGDSIFGASLGVMPAGTSVTYRVSAEDADGNVIESSERSFQVVPQWVRQNRILLVVDTFDSKERDQSALYYRAALDALAFDHDFWDTSIRGTPDSDDFALYQDGAVIWSIPGSRAYLWDSLNADAATSALSSYLDNGGNLFISGERLFDLHGAAQSFYRDYLHSDGANWCGDVWGVNGVPGDEIGDGLSFRIQWGDGANNQDCHHSIVPRAPATTVFSYADVPAAGLLFPPQQDQDPGLFTPLPQQQSRVNESVLLLPDSLQDLDPDLQPLERGLDVGGQTSEGVPDTGTLNHNTRRCRGTTSGHRRLPSGLFRLRLRGDRLLPDAPGCDGAGPQLAG